MRGEGDNGESESSNIALHFQPKIPNSRNQTISKIFLVFLKIFSRPFFFNCFEGQLWRYLDFSEKYMGV